MEFITNYLSEHPIELLASLFGIICVYLNTREIIWGWPASIIGLSLYAYTLWQANLFGYVILSIIYASIGFYGWYNWLRGGKKKTILCITRLSLQELIIFIGLTAAISILCGKFIAKNINDADLPYWNASIACFGLLALWQLARKKIESWLVWTSVNIICVGIYSYKEIYSSTLLYSIYVLLCTRGYIKWKKKLGAEELALTH